jgi:hypothetical protein
VSKNGCRQPFLRWLAQHANFQTQILSNSEDAGRAIELLETRVGFVGLVEHFNESLVLFRHWAGDELDVRYRSRNVALDNQIKARLLSDPKTVARIRACHAEDQKLYDYARNVIYPRQIARFGPGLTAALEDLETSLPAEATLSLEQFVASAKRNMLYKPLTRYMQKAA